MNIYFFLCDELRADVLGYMGNSIVKTPNINELAKDSVVFTNSYCNTPMCVPSRVSIATGRYALSHGAMDNMLRPRKEEKSIFQILKDIGYYTINHGKWHGNINPLEFGFYESADHVNETSYPERYVSCFGVTDKNTRKKCSYKRNKGNISLILYGNRPSKKDETLDSLVTDEYIKNIEELYKKDVPFFARLSIMDPHTPYFPSEPYASMYDPKILPLPDSLREDLSDKPVLHRYFRASRGFEELEEADYRKSMSAYYGLVSHVDERIGKAVDKIKKLGDYDDSLIIFTADHGSMMGEHGFIEKWGHMYEPVMRTPLIIKFPKNQYAGKYLDSFVESIDIMPTILDILGITIPNSVQGKSLLPYIKEETKQHKREIYAQYYCGSLQNKPALMVRDQKWKYTYYPEGNCIETRLLNDDPLKMSGFFDKDDVYGELYDLEADPEERSNLFVNPKYKKVVEEYQRKIDKHIESLGEIVNTDTTPDNNDLGIYILTQGENMRAVSEFLKGEAKLKYLKPE